MGCNGLVLRREKPEPPMSQLGQKPKLPRNINGRFNSINGHNAAKLPVLPTAEALSPPAATTLASKGRLIHWTLPGSTPNRAANQLRLWPRPRNCATAGSSRTRFRCGLRVSSPTIARPCAVNARPSGLPSRSPRRQRRLPLALRRRSGQRQWNGRDDQWRQGRRGLQRAAPARRHGLWLALRRFVGVFG